MNPFSNPPATRQSALALFVMLLAAYLLSVTIGLNDLFARNPTPVFRSNNHPDLYNSLSTGFVGYDCTVESLVTGHQSLGRHAVRWDATGVPGGVYFVRMEAGNFTATNRVLFLK